MADYDPVAITLRNLMNSGWDLRDAFTEMDWKSGMDFVGAFLDEDSKPVVVFVRDMTDCSEELFTRWLHTRHREIQSDLSRYVRRNIDLIGDEFGIGDVRVDAVSIVRTGPNTATLNRVVCAAYVTFHLHV